MWKRHRHPASGAPGTAVRPVAVHVVGSSSGTDSLDERLIGRRFAVVDDGVDSEGERYLVLGDDAIVAYVNQLDFYFLESTGSER